MIGNNISRTKALPKTSHPARIMARRTVAGPGPGVARALLILLSGTRQEQEVIRTGLHASSTCALEAAPAFIVRCIREEQPGLVVMTAWGRDGRSSGGLGFVAQSVLSHADTPILLVRKPAFASVTRATGASLP